MMSFHYVNTNSVLFFPVLEVEYYNPQTKTWCAASPLPTAIFYPEASACGSVIYTLGSEVELTDSFNPSLDCFYCYDAQKDQWSRLMAEFGQFFHATLVKAVSVNNTLHLCDLSTYKVSQQINESDSDKCIAVSYKGII